LFYPPIPFQILDFKLKMLLTADFRYLIFLNYRVERELLESRVPPGAELDLLNGHLYISLVAFLFENLHIEGLPAPFHQKFEEVNLRFYVKQKGSTEEKHGVVLIREIVPKTLMAVAARVIFNEKYISLPMEHELKAGEVQSMEYSWNTEKQRSFVRAQFRNEWEETKQNSAEHWLMKRPYGFTATRDGNTQEIIMEHPDWRITPILDYECEFDIPGSFGTEFAPYLILKTASAFIAEGSPVKIFTSKTGH
jgi:uncharacterized protein YqjF (DUF2071 family)